MTFDERVRALAPLGFTDRQTRFLVTVALHGGFCLRRQYAAFARIQYGQNVRGFLNALVARNLARQVAYRRDRGFLYHLYSSNIYRAIDQDDNRNRRLTGPPLIARKLMVLDFVLSEPAVEWLATEAEKVAVFTERFQISRADLPHRVYAAADPRRPSTTRYFVEKLPIYCAGDPLVPHFVYLDHALTQTGCEQFLRDYARLLAHLPTWRLVVLAPRHIADVTACQRAFERFRTSADPAPCILKDTDLRWYFAKRRAVEQQQFEQLSVAEVARFREVHRELLGPSVDALYRAWVLEGDEVLRRSAATQPPTGRVDAHLEFRSLPHRYSQFGDFPGVC